MTEGQWGLVETHLGMVRVCAKQVVSRLPVSVEAEDLVGIGKLALIRAAERFEPARGVPFAAYARHRVRGAMLDAYTGHGYAYEMHDTLHEDLDDGDEKTEEGKTKVVAIDQGPGPEELAGHAVLGDLLLHAMECLTFVERQALQDAVAGIPLRETGARYGHSISWAHGVLTRAKAKMRRELAMHRLDAA